MDVSKYKTVGDWYRDNRGRVPVQMAAGLGNVMKADGLTFAEAYVRLVAAGRIIEADETE